jgi:hypothetical protein
MFQKKYLVVLVLSFLPLLLSAQGVTVNSNPPGAEVTLEGDMTVNGLTPVVFMNGLEGKYRLTISEYGYEDYSRWVFLHPDRSIDLTVTLKSKTRFKAALRSMFIPGWGQMYAGQKTKGVFFTLLAAGAASFYLIADNDYNDKFDYYEETLNRYNRATTFEERDVLYRTLSDSRKDAYDAETLRNISIGSLAAIWGVSFLDALLFFPGEKGNVVENSLTVKPDARNGGAQLVFSHKF